MTRRPIKTRGAAWVQNIARVLTNKGITPNQISIASMGFAALACIAFCLPTTFWSLLLAALAIQLRLLCNLLDGIVAVEGGESAPDGPFWNEAPDRLADTLILAGLGHAAGAPLIGIAASAAAITTAYLRELGRAEGMKADFSGPFAKPQRMAAATIAALVAAFLSLLAAHMIPVWLTIAVWVILLGTIATALFRSRRLIVWLNTRSH